MGQPQLLAVTPEHFAEHLEVIRARYRPMHLRDLAAALGQGRVPRRAVVVTMDDGYADNVCNARPLLERYEVPGTIFVTSGYVGSGSQFWWDELERLVLQPGTLPPSLRFSAGGQLRRYDVDMKRIASRTTSATGGGTWSVRETQRRVTASTEHSNILR